MLVLLISEFASRYVIYASLWFWRVWEHLKWLCCAHVLSTFRSDDFTLVADGICDALVVLDHSQSLPSTMNP